MAIQVSAELKTKLDQAIEAYAKTLGVATDGFTNGIFDKSPEVVQKSTNILTISAQYTNLMTDELVAQGADRHTAKRIAKATAKDVVEDAMHKVN
jgi:hypothetical protein